MRPFGAACVDGYPNGVEARLSHARISHHMTHEPSLPAALLAISRLEEVGNGGQVIAGGVGIVEEA